MGSSELTRRVRLKRLGWLMILTGLVIISRLFYLQVVRHDYYQVLADETHYAKFEIAADRGEVYVFDGAKIVPLVLNQTKYRLFADPRFINDKSLTARRLAELTGGDQAFYQQQLEKRTAYAVLEKRLDGAHATKIRSLNLDGIGLTKISVREYPEEDLAAQTLGFVNDEGEGQYGVEQAMDDTLKGIVGQLSGAVDVRGVPIVTAENVLVPPRNGADVVLTLDKNLQAEAERALARSVKANRAKGGSVLVMDAKTGDIKAMANLPSFNPADFRSVSDISVFGNPVVSLAYEPGSVMKAFTMATGLERGAVTPDTTFVDESVKRVADRTIKNSEIRPVAVRNMRDVIKLSLNTGSMFVLEQLGGGEINKDGKRALYDSFVGNFLLNQPTGIEQVGEAAGTVAEPDSSSDVRYATMTFGQGLSPTMIRMASAFASIVNGGTQFAPRLVYGIVGEDGELNITQTEIVKSGAIKPEVSQQMVDMMRAVVETGAGRRAKRAGYIIGAKTGTAQKFNLAEGRYYPDRIVSSFFGFTGNSVQRYVILVRIDEPRVNIVGASSAAQVFAGLSGWLIEYYAIPPT